MKQEGVGGRMVPFCTNGILYHVMLLEAINTLIIKKKKELQIKAKQGYRIIIQMH